MTYAQLIEKHGKTHTEKDEKWFASSSQLDGTPSDENGNILQSCKKSPSAAGWDHAGEDFSEVCQASELVAQRQLNFANRAYNVIATTPGNAKGTVCEAAVTRAKNMAVKSVWNINLKNKRLLFIYGCAF
jgi:hypothetical protein